MRANDTGTGITVTGNTSPADGTLTINPDGSVLYTPAAGYSGPDSFGYTITDAFGRTSSATASLTVNPVAADMTGSGTGPGPDQCHPGRPDRRWSVHVRAGHHAARRGRGRDDGSDYRRDHVHPCRRFPWGRADVHVHSAPTRRIDVSAPAAIDLTVGEPGIARRQRGQLH